VRVGDAPPVVLEQGDSANIPANAPHSFRNAAEVEARLLCTVVPSGLEKFFAEFGDPVANRTSPAPELSDAEREQRLRIARAKAPEYGMGFVPPPSRPEG
jgi:Cupin domain